MDWIYLDNNATTRPEAAVLQAMAEMHEHLWANPSSVHRFGQAVRQRVELARAAVGQLIRARDREIVFTSGGTESNNLALRGILAPPPTAPSGSAASSPAGPRVLLTTKVEHSAIREPAEVLAASGVTVAYLPVDSQGVLHPATLAQALGEHARPAAVVLVSVQWANNETGTLQPIADLSRVIAEHRRALAEAAATGAAGGGRARIVFHVDATQAVGKMPVDVAAAGVDLMTFAGHKFHGPKGVGVLFIRSGVKVAAQNRGGPQERDRRGGTENTAGIVGLGVAAGLAEKFVADAARIERLRGLRDRLEAEVCAAVPEARVNAAQAAFGRLWNTSNIAFPRLEAEAILLGLSERGLCASAGAACSSGSLEPSPVLLAMGMAEEQAHGSVRFSLSRHTVAADIDQAVPVIVEVVRRLSRTLPMGAADRP